MIGGCVLQLDIALIITNTGSPRATSFIFFVLKSESEAEQCQ